MATATAAQDTRKRGWVFTLNNYTEAEITKLGDTGRNPRTQWLIFGQEVGENGTPHLQGFVYFKNAVRLSSLKTILPRAHWEPQMGTFADQKAYCSKGEQSKDEWLAHKSLGPNWGLNAHVHEFGTMPLDKSDAQAKGGQATKDKFDLTVELAKKGEFSSICSEHLLKFNTAIKRVHMDFALPVAELEGVCGLWLHGRPWTGKSKFCRDKFGSALDGTLFSKDKNKWWDGYNQEPYVLIDDLTPDAKNIASLADRFKQWADCYPFKAEIKGGYMNIRPRLIIVTSNYTVEQTFGSLNDQTLLMAISRRFTQISFDTLFNVRAIPPMMVEPGKLDYMYDAYDPLVVDLALPADMRALGKRLQPPSPLPVIPEVRSHEDELSDFLRDLDDDHSEFWVRSTGSIHAGSYHPSLDGCDSDGEPHYTAIGHIARPASGYSLKLRRSNAIQSTGRTTTSGLLSGLLHAAGCPPTPPTPIASRAHSSHHRANAQMRSSASSAHPPSLMRPITNYDSEEEERNADVCEDMDLDHRAGAYVRDGWLVDDDDDIIYSTPKRSRGDSDSVRAHKKKRAKIIDLSQDD